MLAQQERTFCWQNTCFMGSESAFGDCGYLSKTNTHTHILVLVQFELVCDMTQVSSCSCKCWASTKWFNHTPAPQPSMQAILYPCSSHTVLKEHKLITRTSVSARYSSTVAIRGLSSISESKCALYFWPTPYRRTCTAGATREEQYTTEKLRHLRFRSFVPIQQPLRPPHALV